jgi:peroxiredoxin
MAASRVPLFPAVVLVGALMTGAVPVAPRQESIAMSQQPGPTRSTSIRMPGACARPVACVLLLFVLLMPVTVPARSGLVGQPAPDFALKNKSDTHYGNHRLSEYRGQVVLLSFWADWCKRCVDQLASLRELQQRYGEANLRVLAVNIDSEEQPAREAAQRLGITVLHDPDQAVVRQYDPAVLPYAVIVDPHGRVRHEHAGYRAEDALTYADELAALILE